MPINMKSLAWTTIFMVGFLVTACLGQSRKGVSLSSPPGLSTVGSGKISSFNSYSAGASSYGNLYQAPAGGGALSVSLQGSPTAGFGGGRQAATYQPGGLNAQPGSRNLMAGARNPTYSFPSARPAPLPGGRPSPAETGTPGIAAPAKMDTPSLLATATSSGEEELVSPGAQHSAMAYLAAFGSQKPSADISKKEERLTSLAPESPGKFRDTMLKGEEEFRKEEYAKAARRFHLASQLSSHSVESLLSLAHVYFATADDSYYMVSFSLQEILEKFPELPLINLHLRDFYGKPASFERDLVHLEEFVRNHPNDEKAQFVLGYLKWQDGELPAAQQALWQAWKSAQAAKNEDLSETVQTLWRGMVATGKVSGPLEPSGTEAPSAPLFTVGPAESQPIPDQDMGNTDQGMK